MSNIDRLYRIAARSFYKLTPVQTMVRVCTMPGRVAVSTEDGSYFITPKGHFYSNPEHPPKVQDTRKMLQMLYDNPNVDGEITLSTRANYGPACDVLTELRTTYQEVRDAIQFLST